MDSLELSGDEHVCVCVRMILVGWQDFHSICACKGELTSMCDGVRMCQHR